MKFLPTINDVFDDFFNDSFASQTQNTTMRCDVSEKDDSYLMNMELPGFKKEDIKMDLDQGYLTIQATSNQSNEEKDNEGHIIRQERYTGSCKRSFYVGDEVTHEDIQASFENGELKVTIAKKQPKQIEEKKYIDIH